MNPTKDEVNDALQRLNRALESPKILAAKAIAEYRGPVQPVKINQHDDKGGRRLDVVEVVRASQPQHAPNVGKPERRSLLLRWIQRGRR